MRVRDLRTTHAPAATILVRLLVGAVFLAEGIQRTRVTRRRRREPETGRVAS